MYAGLTRQSRKLEFGVPEPMNPLAPPMGELAAPYGAHLRGQHGV